MTGDLGQRLGSGQYLDPGGEASAKLGGPGRIGDGHLLRLQHLGLGHQQVNGCGGPDGDDPVEVTVAADDVDRLGPDRAGRADQTDCLH